jgi:transposase
VDLEEAIPLSQDFAQMLRAKRSCDLDAWLRRATESTLAPFRRFAKGLRREYEAVMAALELPWSTSPVEGHINRLKMLKRQMYGRAKLDLLEKRLLYPFS